MPDFDPSRLIGVEAAAFSGTGYRNQAPGFDPRSGEGARRFGGRFNPPRSFPVIYLCLSHACVVAELTAQALRQSVGVDDLMPREVWSVTINLDRVLDLTNNDTLKTITLTPADVTLADHTLTQSIGEAAHQRGYQAIRSFSATGVDQVLAVLPQNIGGATLTVELIAEWRDRSDLEGR